MLMIVCVLSESTWQPLFGGERRSWYIVIITFILRRELRVITIKGKSNFDWVLVISLKD